MFFLDFCHFTILPITYCFISFLLIHPPFFKFSRAVCIILIQSYFYFLFFLNYFYFILGNFFLIQVLICSIQSKYISNFSITCAYKKSIFQLFPNTNLITINQTISSTLICFLNFIWRNYFTIYSAIIFINKRCIYYFAICCNYY